MKRNGYFTFQTIIDIAGVHGAFSDVVYMGLPVIIKLFTKTVNKQSRKNLELLTRVGTVAHR